MNDTPAPLAPPLPPLLDDFTASLVKSPDKLKELVQAHGSPLNIINPTQAVVNAQDFTKVLTKHNVRGETYYAHKANRSSAFIRELSTTNTKLDVASLGELQHGLSNGFEPCDIMVTGPKNDELLWLAAKVGAVINCDSLDEAERLAGLIDRCDLEPCDVLLRLSGFSRPGTAALTRASRFGEDVSQLDLIAQTFEQLPSLALIGVSFHLDTISVAEKVTALLQCVEAITYLQGRGLPVDILDCGGGYGTTYVAEASSWHNFTEALTDAARGARRPLTWNRHGYGLRAENGVVRGSVNLYPASRTDTGPRYLDECLSHRGDDGQTVAEKLADHLIELWVEPGRALLAHGGFTLGRVTSVRDAPAGTLVACELNARDVSLEEHGVAVDPILLTGAETTSDECEVYLLGNLCLEADLISRRAIRLSRRPVPGDVLMFANTAGYFMDFSADHALHQPIAKTLCMTETLTDQGHKLTWCDDSNYWPHHATTVKEDA